jgi:hypothetical protein
MFGSSFRAPALVTLLSGFLACGVQALPKITRTGRYLYDESGNRFFVKGIAYQEQGAVVASADNHFGEPSSFIDPLALPDSCKRDIPNLQQLTVNTIRVYSVNSTLNHDDCMKQLSAAGIYTIIDLSLPLNGSIDRTVPSWSTNVLNLYTQTIDVFEKYDNVLAYNVGNEAVVGDHPAVAPYIKAAARDIKAYLKSKGSKTLIGYAAINGAPDFRFPLADFLTCDPSGANSDSSAIDMYGLNDYEWCGASGSYAGTTQNFANYNVVAYFGEFGCVSGGGPRPWAEVASLYSADISAVWSGGIAFSYFPARSAAGEFGMATISSDGSTVTTSQDFDNLKTAYSAVTFITTPAKSAAPASTYGACPAQINAVAVSNKLPPTPDQAACSCLQKALSCQFTPPTTNWTAIVGEVITNGCSLLGQIGASCLDIGGDGATGVYGRVADCDPTVKAAYVMSQYYEGSQKNVQACSFAGNGTVNPNASPAGAVPAASSCISNPGAVFTPSAAPTGAPGGPAPTKAGGSSGGKTGAGISLMDSSHALVGLGMTGVVSLLGAVWTLA